MFTIERIGLLRRFRLVSSDTLSSEDFDAAAKALCQTPVRARKISFVAACKTQRAVRVETLWHGEVTSNEAQSGDWIVTNLHPDQSPLRDAAGGLNRYVVRPAAFERLYERAQGETEWGPVFKARGIVDALKLSGGIDIKAPWGERQTIGSCYLLRNGAEVYGNEASSFSATYELID